MKATVDLQVVPIGSGVSVRKEIEKVIKLLEPYKFILQTHASGTNIEGDLTQIFSAVEEIHENLHKDGTIRLISYLKVETRTDKTPTLAGKKL